MTPKVSSFVAVTYVRDLDRSRAFYAAPGFSEQSVGENELSANEDDQGLEPYLARRRRL